MAYAMKTMVLIVIRFNFIKKSKNLKKALILKMLF